jgi:aryl-alcohol dehydrogenase-like predicted oxidoreductase
MERRRIGSLEVTVVGLGCNNFGGRLDNEQTKRVMDAAIDAGINFFDTAELYGGTKSEEFMGNALKGRREKVLLATKFGYEDDPAAGGKPENVRRAVEGSLKRLQTDVIDLYQLHRPDKHTPIGQTLGALNELVQQGKVREIGCSNFSVEQLREAEEAARGGARFVSVQNEYSLLRREPESDGVLAECERLELGFLPFFPLASGLLSGKYRKGQEPPEGTRIGSSARREEILSSGDLDVVERLISFAEGRGHTILELAFSWLLAKPVVASVIAGATKPEQIQANVSAAGWKLSAEELAEVERLLGEPVAAG